MKLNCVYRDVAELPGRLPVFPLAGALLLPRRPIQLNIFETRYLSMLDDALSGERLIGMIQPQEGENAEAPRPALQQVGCAGRIVQYAEIGDGRCFLALLGVARFRTLEELVVSTPYRQLKVDYSPFAADLEEGAGEADVDRPALLDALGKFAEAHKIEIDWSDVKGASNEALVNGLSMMSPYGAKEKQALLEAKDLRSRADMLVAISQVELARGADQSRALH